MNRLPCPSAVVAAMLPFAPAGTASPVASLAQSGGSNLTPGGRLCGERMRGSIPVGATVVTLKSGPKLDFTSRTPEMSECAFSAGGAPLEHAATSAAHASANSVLSIAANLLQPPIQPRNADTVLT